VENITLAKIFVFAKHFRFRKSFLLHESFRENFRFCEKNFVLRESFRLRQSSLRKVTTKFYILTSVLGHAQDDKRKLSPEFLLGCVTSYPLHHRSKSVKIKDKSEDCKILHS
jgi:hypothetical protein